MQSRLPSNSIPPTDYASIGTGPFTRQFPPNASFERCATQITTGRLQSRHNGPASGKIVYDIVPTGQARVNQLQTGEAQLVNNTPLCTIARLRTILLIEK
jgi:ABC-type transport system substrate-binding protein